MQTSRQQPYGAVDTAKVCDTGLDEFGITVMEMYFAALAMLLIGALVSTIIKETWKVKVCSVSLALCSIISMLTVIPVLIKGEISSKTIYFPFLFGEVNFVIDSLSAFFIFVISIMSFLGSVYAVGYIKPYLNRNMNITSHCIALNTLVLSMLTVATVQNALFFLVVWEIMSLSSFFLVIFENTQKNVLSAGIKYMIYMHISVIFILAAFALLNAKTGSFDFMQFAKFLKENPQTADIAFLLAFTGFGIKAGFFPFHNWLPDAHPAAPSHISGIMSGVMIKTGIYGILRMIYISGANSKLIAYTVLVISIISALWGVLYAISRHDIKSLLAYHSIENIGIIGIGIGIGLLGIVYNNEFMTVFGFAGAILHVLNHSVFKELLFFASGSVYKKTHTRDVEVLGGLIKKMPYTSLFFIIGSAAICALPPFNGFISEFLIYAAMILGLGTNNITLFITIIISLAALALIGTMAVLCFTKVTGVMFLGNPRSEKAQNVDGDVEPVMLIPMGILAVLAVLIGILPEKSILFVIKPVSMFVPINPVLNPITDITTIISIIFSVFLLILISVTLLRILINRKNRYHSTWGCGYNKPNNRMQYSASSYADLFISTLKPLFKRIEHIKKPKEIFPKEAYYEVEIEDIEEAYIVKPLIKSDERFLTKFEKIQNGNIQQYILFGLIFLVIAIIGLIYFG